MEKTSYGMNPWINSLLTAISKYQFFPLQKYMSKISHPRLNFRTYSGVAGIIRRRMVVSISVALFSGSFSILIGFFLYAMGWVNIAEAITFVGLLFVMGLMLNGWLILRLMRDCILAERASPRMLRFPRALGPNSMAPWNQPTILPSEIDVSWPIRGIRRCATGSRGL